MSKDFRIKQLRTTQVIVSGSAVGTTPSLLIYSASAATNLDGGVHADLLTSVGKDVWMFVSGAKNDSDQAQTLHSDKILFGGDVVISGTLYAEKQVLEVDYSQKSDLFLSGAIVFGDQGAAGQDAGQARLLESVGNNSGSLFISTGSLYLGLKSSGNYAETELTPKVYVAANGLGEQVATATNTSFNLDINNLTGSLTQATIASGDLFAVADINAVNNESKKITLANVALKLAGTGLEATDGVVAVDLNDSGAGTINLTNDSIVFIDADDSNATKKQTISAVATAQAGDGIQATNGVFAVDVSDFAGDGLSDDGSENLKVDLNSLATSAAINQADSIAFIDSDNVTKKGTIDSLVTAIAGSGLSNTSSQLALTSNEVTVTAGDGLKGGGGVSLGGSVTINVEPNDFAGTGLEDDGSDNLRIAASAAGDGLSGGGGSALAVSTGTGLKIVGDNVATDDSVVAHLTGSVFTGVVQFDNTVNVAADIAHAGGDTDTKITFNTDRVTVTAGNVNAIDVIEDGSNSEVVINETGDATMDFRVETDNLQKAIYTNAEMDYVTIGDDVGVKQDMHLFVSGTIGGVGTEGVAVFGGDVVVSGSLLDGSHNPIKLLSYNENGTFTTPPNATGTNAVAIGNNAVASGNNSIAMGTSTTNQTDATGIHSLAIGGDDATASGQYASAIGGYQNTSSGNYSVTMGRGNTASESDAIAIGKSLTVNTADTIAIGNSSDNASIQLKGNVAVEGTSTLEGDVTLGNTADLIIPTFIKHKSDLNTYIQYNTDRIRLVTNGATDVDITTNQILLTPGADGTPTESAGLDVAFYVSGSVATQGTTVRATSLFGGDVHVSGSLSGPDSFTFGNDNTRIFRDGNNLKFDDGNNTVKTLSELATVPGEGAFINGVHGGSNNSKAATSASFAIAGTQGASFYTENIGSDVLLYVSGGLRSDTAAYGKTAAVFGGAVVFSGSATYLGETSFNVIEATTAIKTPSIQDASGNESIRINSQKVAVGNAINANPSAIFEAPLADNTQAAATNEISNFNIFLNNRSVQTNAFAGIGFDVSTEVDADSIGAAIRAERDTSASTTAANHATNLTFATNPNTGDDALTERMRITHDGKVGIGVDPGYALDVFGDVRIRGNDLRDNSGAVFISADGSANTTVSLDLTVAGGNIFGPPTGDLNIKSDGNLTFVLDNDNNETSQRLLVQNTSSDIFEVTEAGDVVVGNDLFVYGNDIKDSGDHTVITFNGLGETSIGNLTITGSNLVVGPDADGADRSIVFGHSTLKSIMGIDDDQDVFAINTDATFESVNDFEIDASGNVTIGNGDLQIGGDDIKDSGGNIAISFDGSGAIDNNASFSGIVEFTRSGPGSNPASIKLAKGIGSTDEATTLIAVNGDSGRNIELLPAGINFLKCKNPSSSQKEIVINDDSSDIDFRVESNAETHMFFVDGGTDRVGIGIDGPTTTLEIKGANADETAVQIKDSQSSDTIIKLHHENGEDDGVLDLYVNGTANTRLHGNGTLSVASGNLTLETTGTDSDIIFKVDDNTTEFTALTIDGSDLGSLLHTPLDGGSLQVNDTGTDGFSEVNGNGGLNLYRYSDSASSTATVNFYKARGNESSQSALSTDDTIGSLTFFGYDTAASAAARIQVKAADAHGSLGDTTDSPGKILFQTVPNGSSTLTDALLIGSDQSSTIYGDIFLPQTSTIDTTGNLTIEASGDIKFTHDGTQFMQIEDFTGDVAIGSHDPTVRLDVEDTTTGYVVEFNNGSTSSGCDMLLMKFTGVVNPGGTIIRAIGSASGQVYAVNGDGDGTSTVSTTFTGFHDTATLSSDDLIPGMIVESTGIPWVKDPTNNYHNMLPYTRICASNGSSTVFGVTAKDNALDIYDENDDKIPNPNLGGLRPGCFPALSTNNPMASNHEHLSVMSLGEGAIWVTNIAGNITNGDLIESSEIAGYGRLQPDDIMRSKTVAKCTEAIDWDSVSAVIEHNGQTYKKYLTSCTFHCG